MSKTTHQPSFVKEFRTGLQLILHSMQMFLQATRFIVLFALLIFGVLWIALFFLKTTFYDLYLMFKYAHLYLKSIFYAPSTIEAIRDLDGAWIDMSIRQYLDNPYIVNSFKRVFHVLGSTFNEALVCGVLFLIGLGFLFYIHGKRKRAIQEVSGETHVEAKALKKHPR